MLLLALVLSVSNPPARGARGGAGTGVVRTELSVDAKGTLSTVTYATTTTLNTPSRSGEQSPDFPKEMRNPDVFVKPDEELRMCRESRSHLLSKISDSSCSIMPTLKAAMRKAIDIVNAEREKLEARNIVKKNRPAYEIFLGGSCYPTHWRTGQKDGAVAKDSDSGAYIEPMGVYQRFMNREYSTYNPQVPTWNSSLLAKEAEVKSTAVVNFFVISGETRAFASLAEVAYLVTIGRPVVLYMEKEITELQQKGFRDPFIKDVRRMISYVRDLGSMDQTIHGYASYGKMLDDMTLKSVAKSVFVVQGPTFQEAFQGAGFQLTSREEASILLYSVNTGHVDIVNALIDDACEIASLANSKSSKQHLFILAPEIGEAYS